MLLIRNLKLKIIRITLDLNFCEKIWGNEVTGKDVCKYLLNINPKWFTLKPSKRQSKKNRHDPRLTKNEGVDKIMADAILDSVITVPKTIAVDEEVEAHCDSDDDGDVVDNYANIEEMICDKHRLDASSKSCKLSLYFDVASIGHEVKQAVQNCATDSLMLEVIKALFIKMIGRYFLSMSYQHYSKHYYLLKMATNGIKFYILSICFYRRSIL